MQWFLDLSVRAKCSAAMGLMVTLPGVETFKKVQGEKR